MFVDVETNTEKKVMGRPRLDPEKRRVRLQTGIAPETLAYLEVMAKGMPPGKKNAGNAIDRLVEVVVGLNISPS